CSSDCKYSIHGSSYERRHTTVRNWIHLMSGMFLLPQLVLGFGAVTQRDQTSQPLAAAEGLSQEYGSCSVVSFRVRNISQQDVYVEVYPEDLIDGTWEDVICPYDLKDPSSRTVKRILLNPPMLKPGASVEVSYDRCADYERCVAPKFRAKDK